MSSSGCMNKPELLNNLNLCVLPPHKPVGVFHGRELLRLPSTATTLYSDASESYVHCSVC